MVLIKQSNACFYSGMGLDTMLEGGWLLCGAFCSSGKLSLKHKGHGKHYDQWGAKSPVAQLTFDKLSYNFVM